jgi:predicted esterase
MSVKDPGLDAGFDGLRRAHRVEQVPEALRRRTLERARALRSRNRRGPRTREWLARGGLLGVAAGVAACLWLGVSLLVTSRSEDATSAPARLDLVPSAEPTAVMSRGAPARRCPQPLPSSPWDLAELGAGARAAGFEAQVFESETDCGPLTRRYLVRVPSGGTSSSPVLIVLHDAGQTAEEAQLPTRWWFDDLAQRERAVLVYANGSPSVLSTVTGPINAGVWQTDEGAHPAVDDSDYLRDVVDQLRDKRQLARGEVFLAGYGSGAIMALTAALRHPERYAGVAAFLPPRLPWKEDLGVRPGPTEQGSRLRSVFIALPDAPRVDASALAVQWAAALGSELDAIRVTRVKPGFQRVDFSLTSGVQLRIVRLPREIDMFPPPGGGDPIARRSSRARPSFLDGPGAAWEFFHQPPR